MYSNYTIITKTLISVLNYCFVNAFAFQQNRLSSNIQNNQTQSWKCLEYRLWHLYFEVRTAIVAAVSGQGEMDTWLSQVHTIHVWFTGWNFSRECFTRMLECSDPGGRKSNRRSKTPSKKKKKAFLECMEIINRNLIIENDWKSCFFVFFRNSWAMDPICNYNATTFLVQHNLITHENSIHAPSFFSFTVKVFLANPQQHLPANKSGCALTVKGLFWSSVKYPG